uniref:Reverse transcriptase domain-containing protein n=1 Tax=Tanacetum cinerariifolium TaxID=118510 RepID=A0A6L2JAH5_TANCI|nr:reverse transcriptase domain-containing protein [Tanacetum cinerariifolium]
MGENRTSWSDKLDDGLWAFCTAYKSPIGCTPYKLVYGKSCHLLIELEHRAYWMLKHVNFDLKTASDHHKLQLNELSELRDQAYENYVIYKERTKKLHDSKIKNNIFNVGDQVLLFNSRLKIFSGKLKTRWSGPFTITRVFPNGTIELSQPNGLNFKTILLGLPKDIYAAVDSCEITQEIWLRVQQMMKGSDIGIQEKKAKNKHFPEMIASNLKFLNILQPEWSRHVTIVHQTKDLHTADSTQLYDFLKYNQKEVDELQAKRLAKTQDPLALMANSNNPYAFPVPHQDQPSFNQNYMQQPMPNPEYIINPTTVINMALTLMAKAFKPNYSKPTNNNQRISSNLRNRQIAQPGMNMGQDRQMLMVGGNTNQNLNRNGNLVAARAEGNAAGQDGNQIRCYNCRGVGHFARNYTVRPRRRDAAYLQTQLLIAQKEEAGIQLQAKEFDLMADVANLDDIEEVNANYILMANLQQASTSGNQIDKAPVYDSDGSAEVTNVEQNGEIVEQHLINFEETRALYESLYQNLAIEVEKVDSVNRKLKETNADLTTELARFKNQEKCFEISQEKYDKLERCYQQSIYQEQCLSKKINALHLSSGKQIMTLNEEISDLNKQLLKEKSSVSFLLEEKKRLKSDFKIHEDELLDKQIQFEKKIKELNNILVKTGQSIQMIHMLSPKPDSFYHTE